MGSIDGIATLAAGGDQICHGIAEFNSSSGVGFPSVLRTPFGELVWVYIHTDDPGLVSLEGLAARFCPDKPLLIGRGKIIAVLKDIEKPAVVFAPVQGNAKDVSTHG